MQAASQRAAAGNGLQPSCRGCRPPQPVGCPGCEANAAYRDGIPPTGSTPRNVRRISGGEDGGREGGRYRGSCCRRCKGSFAARIPLQLRQSYRCDADTRTPFWVGLRGCAVGSSGIMRAATNKNFSNTLPHARCRCAAWAAQSHCAGA